VDKFVDEKVDIPPSGEKRRRRTIRGHWTTLPESGSPAT
jgi:hypothetical protein